MLDDQAAFDDRAPFEDQAAFDDQACAALPPAQAELRTLLLAMLDRLRRRPSAIGRWRPYLCHLAGEHHLAERVRKLACR